MESDHRSRAAGMWRPGPLSPPATSVRPPLNCVARYPPTSWFEVQGAQGEMEANDASSSTDVRYSILLKLGLSQSWLQESTYGTSFA